MDRAGAGGHGQQAAVAEGVAFGARDNCVFTPLVTLWAWVIQAASSGTSCVAAVARVMVLRVAMELDPCAAGSSAVQWPTRR